MQINAVNASHRALHVLDQSLYICGEGGAVVNDEVRVLLGHRGVPDAKALEAGAFDQARRVISRRIGEYGSATPLADRLRLLALVEQFANGVAVDAGGALELEPCADDPFVIRSFHGAIADLVVGGRSSVV